MFQRWEHVEWYDRIVVHHHVITAEVRYPIKLGRKQHGIRAAYIRRDKQITVAGNEFEKLEAGNFEVRKKVIDFLEWKFVKLELEKMSC